MAVAATNIDSGTDTDTDTTTTNSKTFHSDRLYLISVRKRESSGFEPGEPTVSGTGISFDVIDSAYTDTGGSSRQKQTLLVAMPSSNTTTTLSIEYAFSGTNISYVIDELTGAVTGNNGADAIVQYNTNTNPDTPATSISTTLAAFGDAGNATYGSYGCGNASGNNPSVGGGFTEVGRYEESSEDTATILTEFKSSNDTSVDVSFSEDYELGITGVEIAAAVVSTAVPQRTVVGAGL